MRKKIFKAEIGLDWHYIPGLVYYPSPTQNVIIHKKNEQTYPFALSHVYSLAAPLFDYSRLSVNTQRVTYHMLEMIRWKELEIHNNKIIKWFPLSESQAHCDIALQKMQSLHFVASPLRLNGAVCVVSSRLRRPKDHLFMSCMSIVSILGFSSSLTEMVMHS